MEMAGCHEIFQDKTTRTLDSRPELDRRLFLIRPRDTVMVSCFYRLGRSRIIL